MAAPQVEVNSASLGAWTSTGNGIDVLPGETVSVRLIDPAGIRLWQLSIWDTDDEVVAPTFAQAGSVSGVAMFTAPSSPSDGWTLLILSAVGYYDYGFDRNSQPRTDYLATFGVYRRTPNGYRTVGVNERQEASSQFGWAATLNKLLRAGASGGTGIPSGRTLITTTPIRIDGGASADLSADRTISLVPGTVTGQVLGWNGSSWLATQVVVLTGVTISTLGLGVVHSSVSGVLSSSLVVDADVATNAGIVLSKLGQSGATTGQAAVWTGTAWAPGTPTGVGTGSLTPGTAGQWLVTIAGPATAWETVTGGDWDGAYNATAVRALTGTANVVAMHGTTIQWDTTVVPTLKGADYTVNSGTAPTFTVQAPNATGTTSIGGTLNLTSGTSTGAAAPLNLQSGGVTALQVTSSAKITLYGAGTVTSGTAVPSASEVDGSLYTRTGAPNGSLWGRENAIWVRYLSTGTLPPSANTVQIVADMPSLEALPGGPLTDGIMCIVQTPWGVFRLNKTGTPSATGDMFLPPASGGGRWETTLAA